jgi:hypothetical protein
VVILISGGSIIEGSIPGELGTSGNLEAVIGREREGGSIDLQHYWRDQSLPGQVLAVG